MARLDTLPEDSQAVSHLFKQGRLPVPYGNLEALEDMTKELVVGSSGKLAEFFSNKIRNGGLLDATGKLLFLAAHKANALFTNHVHFNHALLIFASVEEPVTSQSLLSLF